MKANTLTAGGFNESRYWLWWVLATAGGWWLAVYWLSILLTGLALSFLNIPPEVLMGTAPLPDSAQLPLLFLQLATLFIVGAVVGGAQWLILRRQIPQVSRWPLFTAIGCLITLFAGPFWLLLSGLGMGLLQWLILRVILNRAGWWSVASTGAWVLGFILGNVVSSLLPSVVGNALAQMIGYAVMGIVGGALTGAFLLWLLRQNRTLLDGLHEEAEQAK